MPLWGLENALVPIACEEAWALERLCTLWKKLISVAPVRILTKDRRARTLFVLLTTLPLLKWLL